MPGNDERSFRIAVDIGQYHFVDYLGRYQEWIPAGAKEWWNKQRWLKDGGYEQDNGTSHIRPYSRPIASGGWTQVR